MERARNKFRIKVCNYMIVATLVGCILMIFEGKRKAKAGESVRKMNEDFHKQYDAMSKKQ